MSMSMSHPVSVEATQPDRFERLQLLLRLALAVAIGYVGVSLGWLMGALYLGLPVFAAAAISSRGGDRFLSETAPPLIRFLRWVVAFYAYMALVVDRFPVGEPYEGLVMEAKASGKPTAASALWRLVASLPAALFLCVLAFVGSVVWVAAAIFILARESYPASLHGYQCGVLRLQARLLAYLASVVDTYPPLSLDRAAAETAGVGPEPPVPGAHPSAPTADSTASSA